jgi:tripartite ATP-independent transporter DctM subunit
MAAIAIVVRINPAAGPAGDKLPFAERIGALVAIWPVLVIFVLVMGGIYGGVFTPTEGAGVGAVSTFLVAVFMGGMRGRDFVAALLGTAKTSGLIFLIVLGAAIFNAFLGFSELPNAAAGFFANSGLSPYAILIGMIVLYIALGMVMDSLSMIFLTVPIFWPIIAGLDFGLGNYDLNGEELKLWFGVLTLIVVEMGLITPPVGLNVFIIHGLASDVPMSETFKGVLPFLLVELIRIGLLLGFPSIVLILPQLLG